MNKRFRKLGAVAISASLVMSMSLTAFAKEADGVEYEKITNEDGSDPVWVVKGSSEDPGEGRKVEETKEFKAEQVAIVQGEINDITECNVGEAGAVVELLRGTTVVVV